MVGFWTVACFGVFFYFIFKFRAKDGVKAQYITGETKEQKKFVSVPHALVLICDVFVIAPLCRFGIRSSRRFLTNRTLLKSA